MFQRVLLTALVIVGGAVAVRILLQFRGLPMPVLPRRAGGRIRRVLRVHSYLPGWHSAAYFLAAWAVGLGSGRLLLTIDGSLAGWAETLIVVSAYFALSVYIGLAYDRYHRVERWEQFRVQRRRDARAAGILAAARSGGDGLRYSLWLRPFLSTGRIRIIAKSRYVKLKHEDESKGGYHIYFGDFETVLAEAVEPIAPLVALGDDGEQVGAGRVKVGETEWQDTFVLLASRAHSIFLMPSLRPGTQWELNYTLNTPEVLRKCVFVLPPDYRLQGRVRAKFEVPGASDVHQPDVLEARRDALEALSQLLADEDYLAMENAASGALFRLGGSSGSQLVELLPLRVATWWLGYWEGPRFVAASVRSTARWLMWEGAGF